MVDLWRRPQQNASRRVEIGPRLANKPAEIAEKKLFGRWYVVGGRWGRTGSSGQVVGGRLSVGGTTTSRYDKMSQPTGKEGTSNFKN